MPKSDTTIVSTIEKGLILEILRGELPPGVRLAPIRELAAANSVNAGTIQRVVARLEARGLVNARRGSGVQVNDPQKVDDLSLMPFWITAELGQPRKAVRRLADLLAVRRLVISSLAARHAAQLGNVNQKLAEVVARIEADDTPDAVQEAHLEFMALAAAAIDSPVAQSLVKAVARVVREVPEVARARTTEPVKNRDALVRLVSAVRESASDLEAHFDRELAALDQATVRRFLVQISARR